MAVLTFSQFDQKLLVEHLRQPRWSRPPRPDTPVEDLLREAAAPLKIVSGILLLEIQADMYRNKSGLSVHHVSIGGAHFKLMAKCIVRDKWLVSNFVYRGRLEEQMMMMKKIQAVQDEWFTSCTGTVDERGSSTGAIQYELTGKARRQEQHVHARKLGEDANYALVE